MRPSQVHSMWSLEEGSIFGTGSSSCSEASNLMQWNCITRYRPFNKNIALSASDSRMSDQVKPLGPLDMILTSLDATANTCQGRIVECQNNVWHSNTKAPSSWALLFRSCMLLYHAGVQINRSLYPTIWSTPRSGIIHVYHPRTSVEKSAGPLEILWSGPFVEMRSVLCLIGLFPPVHEKLPMHHGIGCVVLPCCDLLQCEPLKPHLQTVWHYGLVTGVANKQRCPHACKSTSSILQMLSLFPAT